MSDPPSPHSKNVEHELSSPELADPDAMNASDQQGGSNSYDFDLKEQDRWLPIANDAPAYYGRVPAWHQVIDANHTILFPVARIMKNALPDNAKIAKEAKECMQECVSEFISFVTSEASEKCQQEKRKTVNGEDIIFSMTSLGFENYAEALKIFLARHRDIFPNPRRSDRTDAQIGAQSNSQSATQHEQGWRQQSGDEGEDRRYSYSSQQELSGDPDAM